MTVTVTKAQTQTDPYAKIIEQFLYDIAPADDASADVRFEAVVAAVFGTKQRRYGPMPSPEVQVLIRDVIRKSGNSLTFHVPWAARKLLKDQNIDILEFMAVKQLRCLAAELKRFGKKVTFVFRVEDLTDLFLFGTDGFEQEKKYTRNLEALFRLLLTDYSTVRVVYESACTDWNRFNVVAGGYAPIFYKYLNGLMDHEALERIGWQGTIPEEQRDFYRQAFGTYYEENSVDVEWEMARYFAATLTRVQQGASGAPTEPHLQIAFNQPVPGTPVKRPRVFYRSIPERFTNIHRSPWNAKGYLQITENNAVKPKSAAVRDRLNYNAHQMVYGDVELDCDYVLV